MFCRNRSGGVINHSSVLRFSASNSKRFILEHIYRNDCGLELKTPWSMILAPNPNNAALLNTGVSKAYLTDLR